MKNPKVVCTALAFTLAACANASVPSTGTDSGSGARCLKAGTYTFSLAYDAMDSSNGGNCPADLDGAQIVLQYGGPTDADAALAVQTRTEGGIPPGAASSTVQITTGGSTTTLTCVDEYNACSDLQVLCDSPRLNIVMGQYQYLQELGGSCLVVTYSLQGLSGP